MPSYIKCWSFADGSAFVSSLLPLQMSAGAYSYLVFATVCFSVAIYVYFIIPETKNKTFMEISQMFSRKQPILDTQGLILGDQLQLKKMNGYGGLENTSLDFDSSSCYRTWPSVSPCGWTALNYITLFWFAHRISKKEKNCLNRLKLHKFFYIWCQQIEIWSSCTVLVMNWR